MDKRRVLLLCTPSILSEGVAQILREAEDVELIGPWEARKWSPLRHEQAKPHVVLVAEPDGDCDDEIAITSSILERYADVPVIRVCVADTAMRVHAVHSTHAHVESLMEVVRQGPAGLRIRDEDGS